MSINQDVSSSTIQIHLCTVERVYKSGLIRARSNRDKVFGQINSIFFAAEGNYTAGDKCFVISDGSQHVSLGLVNEPRIGDNGSTTIKNINNDLADLTNAKALVATDKFGSQAKVVAAPGGGVIMDSGGNAVMHLDPGHDKIMQMSDRKETFTIPFYADLDHDGVTASSKYKWRTVSDGASWDRDLARDRNDALDLGGVITAEIGPAPDVMTIEYKIPVVGTIAKIEISTDGGIVAQSGVGGLGKIKLGPLGDVELRSPLSALTINPGGGITLGNQAIDVVEWLDQTLKTLQTSQTITLLGPQPLVTAPIFGVLSGLLQGIKG